MEDVKWVATYFDGSVLTQPFDNPDFKYNGDMDTTKVKTYFIQKGDGIICGVDIKNRILIINGAIIHTDLPEGMYQLVAFKRVLEVSDGTTIKRYCFGLQGKVKRTNHKILVFLHPDGSYQITK